MDEKSRGKGPNGQEGERFRVERFYLVPQTSSLGHTELDEGAVAALVEELMGQGKAIGDTLPVPARLVLATAFHHKYC